MLFKFKANVGDRLEESIKLLFSSKVFFLKLVLPIFLYKMIIGIVIWNFISFGLLGSLDIVNNDIFSSPYYISIFFFVIVGFILYITFFIGVLLATIKGIKDILEGKEIDIKKNLKYGFDNLINSFNTYWYIFAYITLWPFLFISIGGIFIILGYSSGFSDLNNYGLYLMGFGFLFLLFFMIYRGTKTRFSLVSAVDGNSYTKENFYTSIRLTKNNWWRIIGNYILLGIIISIISSIIGSIFSMFSTSIFDIIDYKKIFLDYSSNHITEDSVTEITDNIKNFYNTFYFNNFIVSIFNSFIENIIFVFTIIFTFIFYKRLEIEYKGLNKQELITNNTVKNIKKEEIEL